MRTIRLRITLDHVTPEIFRVLDVPHRCTLPELHLLLQAGMGWTNSHLHRFETADAAYGIASLDEWDDHQDEIDVPITALGSEFRYVYDFGDNWEHTIAVLGPGGDEPGCPDGAGACPPEDVGGIGGYAEMLEALADPRHPEHGRMRQWAGDLQEFDRKLADRDVRATAGAVPDSVRLVLGLARDGVKLTPGGRLPRSFVRLVQQHRPGWAFWEDRPASREDDLLPLMMLHDLLRVAGLLKNRHGVLTPTKAAGDDLEVVRRLRRQLDEESFEGSVIGTTAGWLAAAGPTPVSKLAEIAFDMLGRGWAVGERPVNSTDVEGYLRGQTTLLIALDMIAERSFGGPWTPGPSARSLLPRAAGLAAYFETQRRKYPEGPSVAPAFDGA
jgi:hypothetical protein